MVCILITVAAYAQPFVSFEGTTKGVAMTLGYQSEEGLQVAGGYNVSVTNALSADLVYGNAGYNILLTHNDEDNFTLTPTVGAAYSTVKAYKVKNSDLVTVTAIKPLFGLELGKDWYMGRLFITANYCDRAYYGIGIKAFFK